METKHYRLYLDEAGDHVYSQNEGDIASRYLGITGVIIESDYYKNTIHPDFAAFKERHFPHNPDEPVILHRKELINKNGSFWRLLDPAKEKLFNDELLQTLQKYDFKLLTVVIDKNSHLKRYGEIAMHPYHYCVVALLERYCGFLNYFNAKGDVMAESRNGREDMQLKEAYRNVWESGTNFRNPDFFQKSLTTKEIKIKQKTANITGLQIADLLAYPCRMELLYAKGKIGSPGGTYGQQLCKTVEGKYNRHLYNGRVDGYGKIFLG